MTDMQLDGSSGEQPAAQPAGTAAVDSHTQRALDDLVGESLVTVLVATVMTIWGWAAYVVLFLPSLTQPAYVAIGLTGVSCLAAYQLRERQLRLAVACYVAGLLATVTVIVAAVGIEQAAMLYVPAIAVIAALTGAATTWGLAAGCALVVMVAGLQAGLVWPAASLPGLLIGLTALSARLSSRRLYTALAWAFTMTEQARRNAEAAQAHRAELKRTLQTLDIAYERLERTNRALIFAQEAAEQAYRFKADFVANVSHELRTPLNLIIGFSEMMATAPESYGGMPLPRAYRGDMLATYRNARHLLELINDVLDLSQLDAGQLPLTKERVELAAVIQEAAGMVQGLADAHGLALELEMPAAPVPMVLDQTRIRQVLLNLLTNAMRYTERGFVRIHAMVEPDAGTVHVCVADSGRGIDPANLARAFEAFSRLDEEQVRNGSGLGLAISKRFIELHDGRIWIESTSGRGTTVHFTLPLPEAPQLSRGALHVSRPLVEEGGQAQVLVLHDDARVVTMLRRHVGDCAFTLGQTLSEAAAEAGGIPHVILTDPDWRQGGLEGVALALPGHVHVITCPLPSTRQVALSLGVEDYLPKPVTREELAEALARLTNAPQTALVVDDDPHIVRLIGRMLHTIDPQLHLFEAYGGAEALHIARTQRPDVIFLDLGMPQLGGQAVIAAMAEDDGPRIPIVVVSVRSVEQESAPLQGEIRIQRGDGFTRTELLSILNAVLHCLTRPGAVSPASAAARRPASPG